MVTCMILASCNTDVIITAASQAADGKAEMHAMASENKLGFRAVCSRASNATMDRMGACEGLKQGRGALRVHLGLARDNLWDSSDEQWW